MSKRQKRLPPFETEIHGLGPKGVGVGVASDGREVQVRAAPPGSRVAVRPAGRKNGIWKGVRTAMIRPGADGIEAPCPQFGLCGGCTLQELPLERQRHHKGLRARVEVGEAPWEPLRGSSLAYGYRNKMEFSFGSQRYLSAEAMAAGDPIDGRFLGLHAPGRFDRIVDAPTCGLLSERGNRVLAIVRAWMHAEDLDCWNPRQNSGFLRHLLLREGDALLVGLFTTSESEHTAAVERLFDALADEVASCLWFHNDAIADVAQGQVALQRGPEMLPITLLGKRFELAPLAFFQTSTTGAEVLMNTIGEALGTGHRVLLDLYCGTGAIGICLADHAEQVVGIEVVEAAVQNAQRNAEANGVQARYRVGTVESALEELAGGQGVAAIVDPPRVGLHPKVAAVLATAPLDVLIYVACNAASLGRDRVVLEQGHWVLERCWAVDLFPQTGHLEVVARFVRKPA